MIAVDLVELAADYRSVSKAFEPVKAVRRWRGARANQRKMDDLTFVL